MRLWLDLDDIDPGAGFWRNVGVVARWTAAYLLVMIIGSGALAIVLWSIEAPLYLLFPAALVDRWTLLVLGVAAVMGLYGYVYVIQPRQQRRARQRSQLELELDSAVQRKRARESTGQA